MENKIIIEEEEGRGKKNGMTWWVSLINQSLASASLPLFSDIIIKVFRGKNIHRYTDDQPSTRTNTDQMHGHNLYDVNLKTYNKFRMRTYLKKDKSRIQLMGIGENIFFKQKYICQN